MNTFKHLLFVTTCLANFVLTSISARAQTVPATPPNFRVAAGAKVIHAGVGGYLVRSTASLNTTKGKAHTNYEIYLPPHGLARVAKPLTGPPVTGELIMTPAAVACIYSQAVQSFGCDPNKVTAVPSGGSKAIAVVDAYDLATAASDLATFDAQFGVPAADFKVIWGTGNPAAGCVSGPQPGPASEYQWDVEEDLDIEYAHAMAPKAKLFLVEAASSSFSDLLNAEQIAAACVATAGGGMISNSWGGAEFSDETSYDKYFTAKNVVYFASSGDSQIVTWPSASPNVVSVGGTTLSQNPNTGAYQGSTPWYPAPDMTAYFGYYFGEGAGSSIYEPIPFYQMPFSKLLGGFRGTPDQVAIADPATGVWVFSASNGWIPVGGTSVASPVSAGIANNRGDFYASSAAYLTALYGLGKLGLLAPYFTSLNSGACGSPTLGAPTTYLSYGATLNAQFQEAVLGFQWSECGGFGSPIGTKPF